jgi:hypothetical protein
MNGLVQELSEQAEKYADEWFRGEPTWSEAFESKFAELIVEKCLTSLWVSKADLKYLSEYNQGWVRGRLLAIENIKKDFGITDA